MTTTILSFSPRGFGSGRIVVVITKVVICYYYHCYFSGDLGSGRV